MDQAWPRPAFIRMTTSGRHLTSRWIHATATRRRGAYPTGKSAKTTWSPIRTSVCGPFPRPEESYHLPIPPPPDEEKADDEDKAEKKEEPPKSSPKPVVQPCRAYERAEAKRWRRIPGSRMNGFRDDHFPFVTTESWEVSCSSRPSHRLASTSALQSTRSSVGKRR